MLSSGVKCYHLGRNVIIWDEMLSSGANIIRDEMLSFGASVIIWSFFCYLELILLFGGNVIIWRYHVMLSSGTITPPFLFFLTTSLTPGFHSCEGLIVMTLD
jgi:hypothetical protein